MGEFSWVNLIWAGILGFFIIRLWPSAKDWMKNGPKGTSSDWTTFIVLIAGVALFIAFLIMMVRN
ncbi:hypothetical protein Q4485_02970 [Granulosicoccaceae sp. 1_MG-2023]|nr:hypothetical protein [Granulosicoccaceae sp. 1_MG-2023]